jgi:hypothetical protein
MLVAGQAGAQDNGPVTATLSAPDGQLTVGDPIQLTLALTHPAGYQVILPALPDAWGDFTIVAGFRRPRPRPTTDGSETTTALIDARLFQPGDFNTPALEVSVTDGLGGLQKVMAAPVAVSIASVLQEGDCAARHQTAGHAALPRLCGRGSRPRWSLLQQQLPCSCGRPAVVVKVAVDNRLAHQVALDGLTIIEGLRLPEQGRFKEHYTLVSDTVRVYMERRYGVPTLERTTGEIAPTWPAPAWRLK